MRVAGAVAPQLGARVRFLQWNVNPESDDFGLHMLWEGMVSNVLTPAGAWTRGHATGVRSRAPIPVVWRGVAI